MQLLFDLISVLYRSIYPAPVVVFRSQPIIHSCVSSSPGQTPTGKMTLRNSPPTFSLIPSMTHDPGKAICICSLISRSLISCLPLSHLPPPALSSPTSSSLISTSLISHSLISHLQLSLISHSLVSRHPLSHCLLLFDLELNFIFFLRQVQICHPKNLYSLWILQVISCGDL